LGITKCICDGFRILFKVQAFHRFSKENTDTLILKFFELNRVTSPQYLAFDHIEYERQIQDTVWTAQYGQSIELDGNLVLLTGVFEGPTALYEDYKTMLDYETNAFNYIDTLLKRGKVYSLCVISNHANPKVAGYSVIALGKLRDKKAIPFLVLIADFEVTGSFTYAHFEARDDLRKAIFQTIDGLTVTTSLNRTFAYDTITDTYDMVYTIPIWQQRFKVID
jgi:hypothetical protein